MQLRDYQQRSLDMLYDWLGKTEGNPCVSLPTGSGKSVVIGSLAANAVQQWPSTRILMVTRSQELIQQNAEKLRSLWPGAPMGIYSASLKKKQLGEPIIIGGPLSLANVVDQLGHIDLCIIDECHDISHKDEGSYRKIVNYLKEVNPQLRVIGFTATPFRLGHGLITDKPAIFDDLIEPTSIEELIYKGYLAPLRSKQTGFTFDTSGVHKRGGDFIESELQKAVDTEDNNVRMVEEVIARAGNRKSWMFFCSGIEHAEHIRDILISYGIPAEAVHSKMQGGRKKAIEDFKSGKLRAITNVNALSTGFDHPAIDLLVMARPTMSPGLYLQQAGRGLRIHPDKDDCLVLDFAGVVAKHGPVTAVQPPKRKGEAGGGQVPTKGCPDCGELIHASVMTCPACGHVFEAKEKNFSLRNDDIMGIKGQDMPVTSWNWRRHTSKSTGKEMLAVTYYGNLSDPSVTEYLPVMHEGFAGQKAMRQLVKMERSSGAAITGTIADPDFLEEAALEMNAAQHPSVVEFKKDGKFYRVLDRRWNHVTKSNTPSHQGMATIDF
jgi:DNA repair protein RadD